MSDYTPASTGSPLPTTRPQYSVRRVLCGIYWATGTVVCAILAFSSLFSGQFGPFLLAGAIAALIGWYDYRIWTFRARRLVFLIIF